MIGLPRATTLRQRLLRLMLAATAVAALIVASAVVVYEQTTFKPRVVAAVRQQADTLAAVVLPPLEFSDSATAEQYLATRRKYPDIVAVGLYAKSGQLVAKYVRDYDARIQWPDKPLIDSYEFIADKLHLWHPVEVGGRTAGYLFLCVDIPPLYARLPQYGIMASAVLLALMAVAAILTRGLRRSFLEPVEQLTAVTEQVTQHKDYDMRAPVQHADELGRLATGLNEMLATVASSDRALRHSEARMRSIVDTEPECVKIISLAGALVEMNPAGLAMLEATSLAEVQQQPLLEFVAPAFRELFSAMHRRVIRGEDAALEFEAIGLRGTRRWLDTRAVPLRDSDGSIVGALAITRDVTERKQFEHTLAMRAEQQAVIIKLGIEALSAQSFDALLQRATDMAAQILHADYVVILELMPSGDIAKVRAAYGWEKWYPGRDWRVEQDTPTAHVLNSDTPLLIDDFATDMRFAERVRNHRYGFRSSIAVRIRTQASPWGVVAVHSKLPHAFSNDDVNALQEVANLLAQVIQRISAETAQRGVEAQLLQSQKMDALGRLAGGIAHDFNNLLSAILGNAQLAREDVGAGHPSIVSLEQIQNAGRRAKELVQRILTFSRQQAPRRERLNLQPIVDEVGRLLRATIPASVAVHVQIAADVPMVLADGAQIHQTLLNLGTNAWQAIGGSEGRIDIVLRACEADAAMLQAHPSLRVGRYACITVSDTGCGIDSALQAKIFDPFFTTKPLGEGTGLGLSVVLGIMQAHGGAVTVKSAVGEGASFSLYFPAAMAVDACLDQKDTVPTAPGGGRGERILYIDDEEPLVFLATRLLERAGYSVAGYTKADQALAAFKAEPDGFSLVITDLSMPGMSGMDVAKEILSVRPSAMVVLASGYLRQADIDAALAVGIREVVLKPNTVEELEPIVQRLLRSVRETELRA